MVLAKTTGETSASSAVECEYVGAGAEDEQLIEELDVSTADDFADVEPEGQLQLDGTLARTVDSRIFGDIGYLDDPVTDDVHMELVRRGSGPLQNKEGPFDSVNGRSLTSNWFTCVLRNKKTVPRTRLLYSPKKRAALCFCCLLFKNEGQERSMFGCADSFRVWKKLNPHIYEHEHEHELCLQDTERHSWCGKSLSSI